jgi:type IV fimbrial biogenesis protein FimT
MGNRSTIRGFTLLELMVTIAVGAILMALALPSFQGAFRSNRLATTANKLTAAIALARTDAIKTTRAAGVCGSADGTTCTASWAAGWLVWQDTDRNGALNGSEPVLSFFSNTPAVTVAITNAGGTPARLLFDARGRASANDGAVTPVAISGTSTIMLTSNPCPATQQLVRKLDINSTGQLVKKNLPCP